MSNDPFSDLHPVYRKLRPRIIAILQIVDAVGLFCKGENKGTGIALKFMFWELSKRHSRIHNK